MKILVTDSASLKSHNDLSLDVLGKFGKVFESRFLNQSFTENRSLEDTLNLGWEIVSMLPRRMLDKIDGRLLDKYYRG